MKKKNQTVTQKQTKQTKSAPKRADKPCKKDTATKKTSGKQAVVKNKTAATKASAVLKKNVPATKPKQVQKSDKTKSAPKSTTKTPSAPQKSASKAVSTKQKAQPASTAPKKTATATNEGLVTVEIRIHNDAKGGHPHIMVDTVDTNKVSVGTTHDKYKGKGHKNIPLEQNPLGGKEKTYMRKQGTVDRKENYSETKKIGKMTVTDNLKAKEIGAKAKQKYLEGQKKKS